MDETVYRTWVYLHGKVARGEALSDDDRSRYETGLRELEASEKLSDTEFVAQYRAQRETIQRLQAEREQLGREIAENAKLIERMERQLYPDSRHVLGVGD